MVRLGFFPWHSLVVCVTDRLQWLVGKCSPEREERKCSEGFMFEIFFFAHLELFGLSFERAVRIRLAEISRDLWFSVAILYSGFCRGLCSNLPIHVAIGFGLRGRGRNLSSMTFEIA